MPEVSAIRPGWAIVDVVLVWVAGCFILGGLVALEEPHLQVYPPPPRSAWVRSYAVGGLALVAGIGIVAFVVRRGGRRGRAALRRLGGVLAVAAMFPALIAAGNAAYFGAGVVALVSLLIGVVLVVGGAILLGRT